MKNDALDKKVQELYDIIQLKKSQIAKLERPNYKTNMSFPLSEFDDTQRINLQVVNDVTLLVKLLARLTVLKNKYDEINVELGLTSEFMLNGFSYGDWKHDITSIIKKINIKKEKDDLANKEAKLNSLISPEEKRRLEIEALTKELE